MIDAPIGIGCHTSAKCHQETTRNISTQLTTVAECFGHGPKRLVNRNILCDGDGEAKADDSIRAAIM
jgi:hypothetical protein